MKAWVFFIAGTAYFVALCVSGCSDEPVPFSVLVGGMVLGFAIIAGVAFHVARRERQGPKYISDKAIDKFGEPLKAKPSLPSRSSTRGDNIEG